MATAMVGLPPDFLLSLVALATFMRLSSKKAARVAVGERRGQEIRVRPSFSAQVRSGEPGVPVQFPGRFLWS
jgi:hypothetical protein